MRIEITDYPPNQVALMKTMAEMPRPAALPAFHEGGCNPKEIKELMAAEVSLVEPHFSSVADEAQALFLYAERAVRKKDEARCADCLLLHGPVAFSFPTEEVIERSMPPCRHAIPPMRDSMGWFGEGILACRKRRLITGAPSVGRGCAWERLSFHPSWTGRPSSLYG